MQFRQAVLSALHLLVVLSYFALGCFAMILPSRLDWRRSAIQWLDKIPQNFYIIGAIFMGVGIFFLFCFYTMGRGRFLRFAIDRHSVSVNMALLEQTIADFLKRHLLHVLGVSVAIGKKKSLEITIIAEHAVSLELLQKIEPALEKFLQERFGYCDSFSEFEINSQIRSTSLVVKP